jgi:NTP pyrophosphatase (non-canonical NTP hydrolase)
MEFSHLVQRALAVRAQCAEFEEERYGATWTNEELALGFVGDVGDLAKLVMAQNGRHNIPQASDKLAHELADCLWSVIVLAHVHQIDLEQSFLHTMTDLEEYLGKSQCERP